MTNEEAKEIIIEERDSLKANPMVKVKDCLYEAFDMAIKALEQQPCDDDCISRDDVLTNLRLNWRLYESAEDAIKMSIYDVSNMDSINPKQAKVEIEKEEPAKDCISRAEALRHRHIVYDDDGIGHSVVRVDEIMALPSVTPTRPTGRWIPCTERLPGYGEEVLAFTKHGNIKVAFRDILTEPLWSTGFGKPLEIIAWMPLPEAYTESEDNE